MIKATLTRLSDDGTETTGNLIVTDGSGNTIFKSDTLELPYKNNKHDISCIPIGTYSVIKVNATAKIPYQHFFLMNVPNRDGICIHRGNYNTDVLGCVIVGNNLADINKDGEQDVVNSAITLDKLLLATPNNFYLTIQNNFAVS